jgi:hypothetical protein
LLLSALHMLPPTLIPASPVQVLPTLAGLICGHANCGVLFSDLDDAIVHADDLHAGTLVVETCTVREVMSGPGQVNLMRALGDALT